MKPIAFYLPQFHTIPENDEWWGKGFTEWVNVKKGKPLFDGHDQPKIPLNENYYNLLDDEVKAWQVSLAKENGIFGFCFYHYWFDGKLMLEKPIEQYLDNTSLDLPFCICWANPPWTKIWAGDGSKILIDQEYGDEEQWEAHFQYLLPFMKDERYIKENGCPILVIYSPGSIPCVKKMVYYFRKRAIEEGFKGLCLAYQYYVNKETDDYLRPLFDYCIKFQPVYAFHALEEQSGRKHIIQWLRTINKKIRKVVGISPSDHMLKIRKNDYDTVWQEIIREETRVKDIPCAFVNWDNTPRRGKSGRVISGGTPEKFEYYLKKMKEKIETEYKTDYLFVTAWNEWSEGSYLEPDTTNKYGYLHAFRNVMNKE